MSNSPKLTVINVPSDIGSMIKGKSKAPHAFAQAGLINGLSHIGYNVSKVQGISRERTWHVDGSFDPNGARNEEENIQVYHEVKTAVSQALSGDAEHPPFVLVVGGECNICPAIMSSFWQRFSPKRVGLLYFDGDADLSIPGEPGSSGNLASMTLTHLTMREGALESMKPFTKADGSGVCDPSNTVLFGLNAALQGNTRDQMAYLFDEGFRVFTSSAVAEDPIGKAKQALRWLEERVDIILLHLDVDAIDATTFPLANIPNQTGAGFDKVMAAVKVFLQSEKVGGLVIAEVNPDHDPGAKMIGRLIDELVDSFSLRKH